MKRMIADLILVVLLDISLCVPFALGSEVIYQDENVLMEKVGQMIIKDANRIFWRAAEIPDAELKDLCNMAVVVEKDPANGKTTVLYPFLLYSGDYQKHTMKFINYKGEVLREEHDLDLGSAENFSSEVIMNKGTKEHDVTTLLVTNYKGEELFQVPVQASLELNTHCAPLKHVLAWSDNWRFFSWDSNGKVKTVNFDTGDSGNTKLVFSKNGEYAVHFGPTKVSMVDFLGAEKWTNHLGFVGAAGYAYISSDNKYIFAYYTSTNFNAKRKILLFNNVGQILNMQKNRGACIFYESLNHEYIGNLMLLKTNEALVSQYRPSQNASPITFKMRIKLSDQEFSMDSQYPIVSTNDGQQLLMVRPNRARDEVKHIIRIALNK